MKALILAAGKGTRLKELTRDAPKPMLPIGPKPLLAHLCAWLCDYGITDIAINLHHAPEAIVDYFGDGSYFGFSVTYSYEDNLLGTAGAAKQLQSFLNETFVVVYGDIYTNLKLSRLLHFHQTRAPDVDCASSMTLALYRVPNPTECGLVEMDVSGRVQRFVEKPPETEVFTELANAGVLICEPEILEQIPAQAVFDFGRDLLPKLIAHDIPVYGQVIASDEYLIDIGTPAGYKKAQAYAWHTSTRIATYSKLAHPWTIQ
jgi:mannose-1-phosphate guanylyltransferase